MRIIQQSRIGFEIERIRQKRNLTIEQFAEKLGTSRVNLSNIINGRRQLSKAVREKLGVELVYRLK